LKFGSKLLRIKLLNTIARFLYENELLLFGDSIKIPVAILERSLSMTDIEVKNVRYVKLGTKPDNWEEKCFEEGWIPLGYEKAIDIMELNWNGEKEKKLKQADSRHFSKIKDFYTLGEDTVWVMFRGAKLYWGRASQEIKCYLTKKDLDKYEADKKQNPKAIEGVPKPYFLYRKIKPNTEGKTWSCSPIDLTNKDTFDIEKIDGRISKTANTQHSICEFNRKKAPESVKKYISNLINGEIIPFETIIKKENGLIDLIKGLYHANFELFVANIYIQKGYILLERVGGSTQKDTDLVLLSPDKKRVLVQIKTSANQYDFDEFAKTFKDDLKDNEEAHFIYHSLDDGEIKECKDYPKLKLIPIPSLNSV
jgi:hypothetical protein